jgi:Arc/MetJ family transcription regulator
VVSHTAYGVLLCGGRCKVPSNLAIDDKLLEEALHLGGHRTKKATVNEALKEYVQRRKQLKVLDLFGQIDYDPDYDYKEQRRRE